MPVERIKPGCCYHLYNQGVDQTDLFRNDDNYFFFMERYEKYLSKVVDTYAYVLLPNHFHLLVYIPQAAKTDTNPAQIFSNLFNSYAQSFNTYWKRRGTLFNRHLKRVVVESEAQFLRLICYIHQNPLKHGIFRDYRAYPFSSFQAYIGENENPIALEIPYVLNLFGGQKNFFEVHEEVESSLIDRLTLE